MLKKLLSFAKLLGELQAVERVIRVRGADRWENDVEHSYSLAMLAWYILDTEVPELHAAIRGYVTKEDAESRFVYALDKIEPILKIYLDGGETWQKKGVTLEMLYESKKDKVALSPEIQPYFGELMALLRKEEKELFG